MALGVINDWKYAEYTKSALKKGQIICLSTDGLKEARNTGEEMFDSDPIYRIIRQNPASSATEILDALFESLNLFLDGTKLEDDITLVVVKIK